MVSKDLLQQLNDQMNFEFESSQIYLAMAAFCASENLDGFANFFKVQAEEEKFHAMKFFNYINTIGQRAIVTGYESPRNDYDSILTTFEYAFSHEQKVTKRIYDLSDVALAEREHATISFLKWFIDEQLEEEATFDQIIQKLKRISGDSTAIYLLDEELGRRTFTPGV